MSEIVHTENLSYRYGDETIFSRLNLTVCSGEFVALTGMNGSGKSTLLRLLLGELAPRSGGIRLFGQDISDFKQWHRLGYLAQDGLKSGADFPATAEEVVTANLYAQIGPLRPVKKRHREAALGALARVGMERYAKRMLGSMSGGQRQRVMLARVLVGEPELLVLDEPTNGVDNDTADSLFALLAKMCSEGKIAAVMVTHDTARAASCAARTLLLEYGSLKEIGSPILRGEQSGNTSI
ncbi:MAG: ATP-binding cassette domain-containing protein [Oscillospiraceae bacterium]|jgi:zinc transport system ATP-binding protein|nr:ATP-binding cassette domain-containing protein [Oscillospiraceae bacterium]